MAFRWTPILIAFIATCFYLAVTYLQLQLDPPLALIIPGLSPSTAHMTPNSAEACNWIQSQFNILFGAPKEEAGSFDSIFSSSFSPNTEIRLNHEKLPLQLFKDRLDEGSATLQGAEIDWKGVFETRASDGAVCAFNITTAQAS